MNSAEEARPSRVRHDFLSRVIIDAYNQRNLQIFTSSVSIVLTVIALEPHHKIPKTTNLEYNVVAGRDEARHLLKDTMAPTAKTDEILLSSSVLDTLNLKHTLILCMSTSLVQRAYFPRRTDDLVGQRNGSYLPAEKLH